MGGIGLSDNLKYIGDYAFYNCSSSWFGAQGITTIPSGVTYIGRSAFYNCSSMVGVVIPGSVKTIGDYAFYGCKNLGESELYASVEDMKEGKDPMKGDVIISEGVEHIGSRAFQNCAGIAEIIIPGSVKYIGDRAFHSCTNLKKVVLGEGIQEVPDYTFYKCENLTELHISDSIKSIGNYAFRGCAALANIKIGASVESIGRYAFYGCTEVQEIMIPASVKTIGDYAFRGCTKVDAVILPETIDVIGKHAFYGLNKASFFCESDTIRPYWNERWNSSYRTVFWGCTLSEDGSYVVAITAGETMIDNMNAPDSSLTPEREGYFLDGWATEAGSDDVAFTSWNLIAAPEGTVLYAVWKQEAISD